MQFVKLVFSTTGAACVTASLSLIMVKLIHVDFEVTPKAEALAFETNPPLIPPPIGPIVRQLPVRSDTIEIPPGISRLEIEPTGQPVEGPYTQEKIEVNFPMPKPGPIEIIVAKADTNPQPIIRAAPIVPDKALRAGISGHCKLRFGVNASGGTFDVKTYSCTNEIFAQASVKAAQKFKYRPKIHDGVAVEMSGVETKITFRVLDDYGQVLPE